MRKVFFYPWIPREQNNGITVPGTSKRSDVEVEGEFHGWGMEVFEIGETVASETRAIIEDSKGRVSLVPVEAMRFHVEDKDKVYKIHADS